MATPAKVPEPETAGSHRKLSEMIADLVVERVDAPLTLNRMLDRMEGRGIYLVIIVLAAPFVVPVSLPGLSTVIGGIMILLLMGILLGRRARLPHFFGDRIFPASIQRRLLGGSVRFLRWIEKFVRPRQTRWLRWRTVEVINALILMTLAFLLALPLPSPPFFLSNSIPGYAIILLAASIMEEDGWLIWLGYGAAAVNVVFFTLIGGGIAQLILKCWQAMGHSTGAL